MSNMNETKKKLKCAVDIGEALLMNGGEIYRVEETINHILEAWQIENYDVYVLSNGLFASANETAEDACSIVRHIVNPQVHLGRIAELNQLSREICKSKMSVDAANECLESIKKMSSHSLMETMIVCGVGTGCFTYIFGGTLQDSIISFIIGIFIGLFLYKNHASRFIKNIFGGFIAAVLASLFSMMVPIHIDKVIIGDIMPLVPGIAFTTGVRDLFHEDYLSGAIHILDAVLTGICIAVGVGTFLLIMNGGFK
jgi:uncharacterized membrane protein YjjP (DUF1212 family)